MSIAKPLPKPLHNLAQRKLPKKLNRRQFVVAGAAAATLVTAPATRGHSLANDEIRLGFISCGGRAGKHMTQFKQMNGVKIAGLCDPD